MDREGPPHWYTVPQLVDQIAGLIRADGEDGRNRSIREYIGTFPGLSATRKQKEVYESAGLTATMLADLWPDRVPDTAQIASLYAAVCHATTAPPPEKLGCIGRRSMGDGIVRYFGAREKGVQYAKRSGISLPTTWSTCGPVDRYKYVLFVEKEGFALLIERARIQERFDVALMSTKGMTVVAARRLIEELTCQACTILALHDFDKSGLGILHTMMTSTRRHRYTSTPNVVDIGLRLEDINQFGGLPSEPVVYERSKKDPRFRLAEYGATREEQNFLVKRSIGRNTWEGKRVELNAMTADQL